jgi:hypothetical protein
LSRSSLQAGAISCTIRRQSSDAAKTQTPALHKYLDWWHDLRVTLNQVFLSINNNKVFFSHLTNMQFWVTG